MATTFVHIGDFHAGPGPRNADRFRALDQIISEGEHLSNLGAWLWPGDLNHGRMTIEDRNALVARLARMATKAPVVITYGNHDAPGDLDVFAKLKATYPIWVVARPMIVPLALATGEHAAIFVLRYPLKAELVGMGVMPGAIVETAAHALDAIFMKAGADLAEARAQGCLTLMIGHVNVGGSMTSSGQPNVGHEIEIGIEHLDRLGPIYKGLNHIHVAQEIAGAHYAGSVCRLNWGEIEPKSYITIEYGYGGGPVNEGPIFIGRHPIDVAPMYHVEGNLTRDAFTYVVKDGPNGKLQPKPASWHGCEVRVRYTFNQSEKSVLSDARVLAEFADAKRLEVEPFAVSDRELRAPAVAAAQTLEQKLAAFAQVDALAPSVIEKLAQLQRPDLIAVLADLERTLATVGRSEIAQAAA